jgi:hypothetical protein
MLFDWLITGQAVPANPASAVRGPKHVVKTGKTPVLEGKEWRATRCDPDRYRARFARPGTDRHPDLLLRPDRRGAEDEGGRYSAARCGLAASQAAGLGDACAGEAIRDWRQSRFAASMSNC